MGVRRQIYLSESDDRLLEEQSKQTGLSVSELVRQAIDKCYGVGRKLSWDEFFAHPVRIDPHSTEAWIPDDLFDPDLDEQEGNESS